MAATPPRTGMLLQSKVKQYKSVDIDSCSLSILLPGTSGESLTLAHTRQTKCESNVRHLFLQRHLSIELFAMEPPKSRPMMDTLASTEIEYDGYQSRWESIWSEGLKPGEVWDKMGPAKALVELLQSKAVQGKRILVPGCGRGYDLVAFAEAGAEYCLGLEISEHAMKAAMAFIASTPHESSCTVKLIDFLKDMFPEGESFDLGYDYTMLCALHPSLRELWADAWTRNIKSGGELIVLVFPDDPQREAETPGIGPPYVLNPEVYDSLLLPRGWKRMQMDRVPPELSHPGRQNKEWLGIYSRL